MRLQPEKGGNKITRGAEEGRNNYLSGIREATLLLVELLHRHHDLGFVDAGI
jgi:hypothetical protein